MKLQNLAILIKKNFKVNILKIKNIKKLGTILFIQGNTEVLNVAYVISTVQV